MGQRYGAIFPFHHFVITLPISATRAALCPLLPPAETAGAERAPATESRVPRALLGRHASRATAAGATFPLHPWQRRAALCGRSAVTRAARSSCRFEAARAGSESCADFRVRRFGADPKASRAVGRRRLGVRACHSAAIAFLKIGGGAGVITCMRRTKMDFTGKSVELRLWAAGEDCGLQF